MLKTFELPQSKVKLRESVLNENSAQNELEKILEKTSNKIQELKLSKLNGNLNMSILEKFEFLKVILIYDSNITSIINIPSFVEILSLDDNLLKELGDLPESLRDLSVSSNLLEKIDLSKCKSLNKLNVSYNNLKSLTNLPSSLKTLKCHHNNIKTLDLQEVSTLEILYCDYNDNLVLENVPHTIIEGNYPKVLKQNLEENVEYNKALKKYFQIKNSYEIESKKTKIPSCYGCEKKVGMTFSYKNRKYQARCGGNPPCSWSIVLHRGNFVPIEEVFKTYAEDVETFKEKIIEQKMSTLFRYISEQKSKELFKENMTAYESANKYLEKLKSENKNLFHKENVKEQIIKKELEINVYLEEVKEYLKINDIKNAVEVQYKKILPLSQSIQRLQYEIMEVETIGSKEEVLYKLNQYPSSLNKLEINLGDDQSIGK